MRVSVIIPVYNAAGTLPDALESIRRQSWDEIEICAVNDAGTDGSLRILEEFKTRFEENPKRKLKIISHDRNQGVAAARNTALDAVTGEFICWVDADDRMGGNAVEKALRVFNDSGSDIVGWDWTLNSSDGNRYMRQPDCTGVEEALKALMGGTLRWNLWLFMARKELFDDIRFTPGMNMGEDMMAVIRIFLKARRFGQIHEPLYSYRQTGSSVSRTRTESNLHQVCANLDLAEKALEESDYSYLAEPYISLLKLNVKLPLLVSQDKNDYLRWLECYPEANDAIMLNRHLPMRTKILQKMAAGRMWFPVRLYNKLVYGIFYRLMLCGKSS